MAGGGTTLVSLAVYYVVNKFNLHTNMGIEAAILVPLLTGIVYAKITALKNWWKHRTVQVP